MLAAFSDSHPTLYVVDGRDKPVLHGPSSTGPNLFYHGETTYGPGLYDCLRLLQACFRKGMSACDPLGGGGLGLAQQKQQRPKVVVAVVSRIRSGKNIPDGPLSESDI